ncbi:hypothetical protein C8R44DRAFT_862227 [Mycena epipterygia]|nr:hypothetical protein C8R44DRAFT_862227 [Mycena epipterygia]
MIHAAASQPLIKETINTCWIAADDTKWRTTAPGLSVARLRPNSRGRYNKVMPLRHARYCKLTLDPLPHANPSQRKGNPQNRTALTTHPPAAAKVAAAKAPAAPAKPTAKAPVAKPAKKGRSIVSAKFGRGCRLGRSRGGEVECARGAEDGVDVYCMQFVGVVYAKITRKESSVSELRVVYAKRKIRLHGDALRRDVPEADAGLERGEIDGGGGVEGFVAPTRRRENLLAYTVIKKNEALKEKGIGGRRGGREGSEGKSEAKRKARSAREVKTERKRDTYGSVGAVAQVTASTLSAAAFVGVFSVRPFTAAIPAVAPAALLPVLAAAALLLAPAAVALLPPAAGGAAPFPAVAFAAAAPLPPPCSPVAAVT